MKRREFIALLGGGALAWPLAADAQKSAIPVIGFLNVRSPEMSVHLVAAFHQGLRATGYVEGQNVRIEYLYANGRRDLLPALAIDLVGRGVAVIATGPGGERAAKSATATIPIVFMSGGDPVRMGIVASLNRPGGNLTGVTMLGSDLEAKRIGLLHELVPQAETIAVLVGSNTNSAEAEFQLQEIQAAGRRIGVSVQVLRAGNEQDLDTAFATIIQERVGALVVAASSYFNNVTDRLTALVAHHRIPAIYENREFAEGGGLMTYAPSVTEAYRQVGVYTGRILKGEKPTDLPVMLPTKFEFVINLKTARALGLDVPATLLATADEVIE